MPRSKHAAIIKQFNAIPLGEQPDVLLELANHHDFNRVRKLKALKLEVSKLQAGGEVVAKTKGAAKAFAATAKKTRAKPGPTHRSKKDRSLTRTGRGLKPRWMRQEMKALKLKPSAFLIGNRS